MSMTPRNVVLGVVLAGIVAALVWVTVRVEPVPVDLAVVTRGPMQITINADGKTRIRDIYEVSAPISGTAQRAPVEVGDTVVGGETVVAVVQPVAPSLLDARSRIQAEAAVREAEAAQHAAESRVRQAQEELAYARSQSERVQALVERGVASFTRLEDAMQQLAVREAALAAAQSNRDMAAGALARAQAALIEPGARQGVPTPECCVEILAPIDGTVLDVDVVSEGPVSAGMRLLSIGRRDDLEIVADLLSSDAVRVGPGAPAEVERWGEDRPLKARLRSVEPVARTKVSALGIEEQRVDVRFDLLSPPEDRPSLGEGFAVFLRIVEWRQDDVQQVPLSALFRRDGGWAVFRAEDGVARLTPVEVGRRNAMTAQVLSGLEAGDAVVSHPGDTVADGVAIVDRTAM